MPVYFSRVMKRWLPLAMAVTCLTGFAYVLAQQVLRQTANDPQIAMARDAASALARNTPVSVLISSQQPQADLLSSLQPFLIIMDAAGKPTASTIQLNDQIPTLPAGVLDYAKQHGENRITWQPQAGVREAVVVKPYAGDTNGYVAAGRSLAETEDRVDKLTLLAGIAWLTTMIATLATIGLTEWLWGQKTG